MDVIYPRCCGLDLHKRSVTACRMVPGADGQPIEGDPHLRHDDGRPAGPGRLAGSEVGVTHVAMESTGVYWKPVWNLLEERFTLLLVNAAHVKVVPGRKRDVGDAAVAGRLAAPRLAAPQLRAGSSGARAAGTDALPQCSLVRSAPRRSTGCRRRLEGANIKLASVVSEVTGVSARAMLRELVAGQEDRSGPGRVGARPVAAQAAGVGAGADAGGMSAHQRFMIAQHLAHIDALEEQIAVVGEEIAARLRPFEAQLTILDSIPGIGRWSAEVILAEIGPDMSRFPTAGHLASWAGMCPGHDESAGKRRSGKTRKGSPWLRVTLTEAAYAAGRGKGTSLCRSAITASSGARARRRRPSPSGGTILEIGHALLSTGHLYDDGRAPTTAAGGDDRRGAAGAALGKARPSRHPGPSRLTNGHRASSGFS